MAAFFQTLSENQNKLISSFGEHIYLSVFALFLAIIIALPLAIYGRKHPKSANVFLQIASILQTIPSLAVLGLLIPFVGIGNPPAVIALVIYGVLPIYSNAYTALVGIDPSLSEAAEAFGLTPFQKLTRIELPLAKEQILTGIKNAGVMIIGTATLAALIGAGGLGTFILLGIDRNDASLTLIGAVGSALLAIIFSWLITILGRMKGKNIIWTVGALFVLIGAVGGFQKIDGLFKPQTITIAGKLGSEPDILINMYKDLIENKDKKVSVQLKPNFGQTNFLFSALKTGNIDIYPEFTGTVLEDIVPSKNVQSSKLSPSQIYQLAKRKLYQKYQMEYLQPMKYNNSYTLLVKKSFAQKYHLHSINDLQPIQRILNGGFDLEFSNRNDGWLGIKKIYGLNFTFQSLDPSIRYKAINNGNVNIIDGYSTDSQIRQEDLVSLNDNKRVFPTYQGAALMKSSFAKKNPLVVKALNKLANKITVDQMRQMNYEVNVEKKSAALVAKDYLIAHRLLKGDG